MKLRFRKAITDMTTRLMLLFKDKKSAKKTLKNCLFLFLSAIPLTFSALLVPSFFTTNKVQTVSEIIYKNNILNETIGLIYGHETFSNSYELCPVQPELSKELRSIDYNWRVMDVYPKCFFGSTPATVDYVETKGVDISFLLLPKEYYTYNTKPGNPLYSFELICGQTTTTASIRDIYINQDYADYLISKSNGKYPTYGDLLGIEIPLTCKNEYAEYEIRYDIRGVLKKDSKEYQKYSEFIGDFFLANQYLSLPLKNAVCFEMPHSFNALREKTELIFKIYKYKSSMTSFNALASSYFKYDFRVVGIGKHNTNNNIESMITNSNHYFESMNDVYNFYFNKQNVIPLILVLIIDAIFCLLFLYFDVSIWKTNNKRISNLITISVIVLALVVTLLLNLLPFLNTILKIEISTKSWQSFVLEIVHVAIIFIISRIIKVRATNKLHLKNKENCQVKS